MIEEAVLEAARPVKRATGLIRPYHPKDRDAVRIIACRTAYRNLGSGAVFEDSELFADYWCNYYTDYEPESCMVVEEDGQVIGYLFGCVDAKRFERTMARRIVPGLIGRMLGRYLTFRYRQKTSRRMVRWFLFYAFKENPCPPVEKFPAHYHCNILPQGYGKRYYSQMAVDFMTRLERMGIKRMHGQITEAGNYGAGISRMLVKTKAYEKPGLIEYYAEKKSSFNRVVLGDNTEMVNRAWGFQLALFRDWVAEAGAKYRF